MSKDFIVDITKLTRPVSQQGFGLPLILATDKAHPYTLYNDISSLAEDFPVGTAAYAIASRIFGQNPAPAEVAVCGMLYDTLEENPEEPSEFITVPGEPADLVAELNNLVETKNDWYFLTCDLNSTEVIAALSGWVDTQLKMYFVTTQSLAAPATLESERTVVMYHDDEDAYVAEGLVAIAATHRPGELTFKFKTVNVVLESAIPATHLAQLHKDGGFSYIRKMGVLQTTEGKTTSGEYIDVIMGADFLKVRMEEEAAYLAVNTLKIPYDNQGISMLVSVVDKVLKMGVDQGIVLRDGDGNGVYEISVVRREDASKNDIANRVYNGIHWTATLAGAIHTGTISGYLIY